jgi:hypothetical protein
MTAAMRRADVVRVTSVSLAARLRTSRVWACSVVAAEGVVATERLG